MHPRIVPCIHLGVRRRALASQTTRPTSEHRDLTAHRHRTILVRPNFRGHNASLVRVREKSEIRWSAAKSEAPSRHASKRKEGADDYTLSIHVVQPGTAAARFRKPER